MNSARAESARSGWPALLLRLQVVLDDCSRRYLWRLTSAIANNRLRESRERAEATRAVCFVGGYGL